MKINHFALGAALALASVLTIGCGSADCESLCEDGKDCDNATAETKATDCAAICKTVEDQASKTGCQSQYDDVLSCADDNSSEVCSTTNPCKSESDKYGECITKACTADPTKCM